MANNGVPALTAAKLNLNLGKPIKIKTNGNNVDFLRQICSKDEKGNADELKQVLKQYGELLRKNSLPSLMIESLDMALQEKGL